MVKYNKTIGVIIRMKIISFAKITDIVLAADTLMKNY